MALLQSAYITRARARARASSPLRPVRDHRGLRSRSLRFALSSLPSFSPAAISFLLAPDDVGICTGVYFVLGVSHGS